MTLEDIGEDDTALLCVTNLTACCQPPHRGGKWLFPNGSRVGHKNGQLNFYANRGESVVRMHRRRGGEDGIYHCEIPDSVNVTQTMYIGVYTAGSGE